MKIESVYIELTNLCNLNCKTCYNRSGLNKTKEQLSFETVLRSIELFRSYGAKSFQLSGGETMLYDHIEELFRKAADMPEVPFTISTNGTVKHELLLGIYRTTPNIYVQISLDGSCEEVNAKTRGQGHFDKTVTLLDGLHSCSRPVGYRLKMVVSKLNLYDIPSYFDLAVQYGCEPRFAFMNSLGNGGDNKDEMALTPLEKMTALRLIDKSNQKHGTKIELPFCAFSCPLADSPEEVKLGCMVKSNGDIMPCQALYDSRYRLGSVYSYDENEVYDNLRKLQEITQARMAADYGCERCLLNPLCKRGCPAMALAEGDILASDGECEFRLKHYLKYQLR